MIDYCDCKLPEHGADWIAMGVDGSVMDYQCCDACGKPIMGTQETHVEENED